MKMLLVISALLLIASLGETVNLRVGAWNLESFGQTKVKDKDALKVVLEGLRRYDIVSVLEVKDRYLETPGLLLTALNTGLAANDQYDLAPSMRVGSGESNHREQYAVYYKKSRVKVQDEHTYPDLQNRFTYDPYVVEFEILGSKKLKRFKLISIHVKPSDAVKEINELANVYQDYKNGINDIMFIGDFNAGCTYVRANQWNQIAFRTDPTFKWLIGDDVQTNVKVTPCPYDRIVVAGKSLQDAIVQQSAQAHYFNPTHMPVCAVTDHYPVEVVLDV